MIRPVEVEPREGWRIWLRYTDGASGEVDLSHLAADLLKGCFAAVRNPRAHEPRILWKGEDDAADYLTLIFLLHRKLDACKRVGAEDIP